MKIYLEYVDEKSSKFWSVEVKDSSHTVTYGRIGSAGRAKESAFSSNDEARADAEKQAAKKRKKGYSDAAEAEPSAEEKPAAKSPAAKEAKKSAPKKSAPKKAKKKKPPSARTLKSFFKAIEEGNLDKIKSELERAIDANTAFDISDIGQPWPALYFATRCGESAAAKVLLEAGADASATFGLGGPLFVVRDDELAQLLIDGGADPNHASKGYSPLHRVQQVDVAKVLIAAGADVNAEAPDGKTPYESTMNIGIRRALLAGGAAGLRETKGENYAMTSKEVSFEEITANNAALGVGAEGELWVCSFTGFYRTHEGVTTCFSSQDYPAASAIAAAHGSTYIATNQGLLRFSEGAFTRYTANNSPLHDEHVTSMAVLNDEVWCIGYEYEESEKHVSVFDGESWKLLEPGKDLPAAKLEKMMVDSAGRRVLSDDEESGVYVQGAEGAWIHESLEGEGFFAPKVYAMSAHEGTDYFGTHKGLFRRAEGGFEKMHDGAFGSLAWANGTLWAATNWDGLYAFRDGEVEHYDEDRAGCSLSNVKALMVHEGILYLLAGQSLIRVRDGNFSVVGA